ncbi:MAG: hypothetical protein V3573_05030 [Desulfovibrionaceae bacterium]
METFNISDGSVLGTIYARAVDSTPAASKEQTQESTLPQGDTITFSSEALSLSQSAKSGAAGQAEEDNEKSAQELTLERINERIKEIQEEMDKVRESDMTEEQKQQKLAQLEQELSLLNDQKAEILKAMRGGSTTVGGTNAEGVANSLT